MTPALLPVLGLLLAVDAPPPLVKDPAPRGDPTPGAARASAPVASKRAAVDVPLPPPPVLRARAAARPVDVPLPPPPVPRASQPGGKAGHAPDPAPTLAVPSGGISDGERLIEQKCSKCHDVSWVPAAGLSAALWRAHLKRPGVAVSEEQVTRIQRALEARRARSPR